MISMIKQIFLFSIFFYNIFTLFFTHFRTYCNTTTTT